MAKRATFDVYGRLRVTAEKAGDGVWELYRVGSDGKRSRITDVVVLDHATLDEVEQMLEAAFHELGRPGSSIVVVDS